MLVTGGVEILEGADGKGLALPEDLLREDVVRDVDQGVVVDELLVGFQRTKIDLHRPVQDKGIHLAHVEADGAHVILDKGMVVADDDAEMGIPERDKLQSKRGKDLQMQTALILDKTENSDVVLVGGNALRNILKGDV